MRTLPLLALLCALTLPAFAQQARVLADDAWCEDDRWYDEDRERYCEVREITLPAGRAVIAVDAGQNGGISVEGWDRDEIRIRAKVVAMARDADEARERVRAVRIDTDGTIEADVPRPGRNAWAWVSYEVMVPHRSNLDLETHNGGIHIEDVAGEVSFRAVNGGVSLEGLAGDVRGRTTNGGLAIALDGDRWNGAGLDVETTNGGVELVVPDGYSARLETRTVNGKVYFDFPVTVQGRIDREFSTDLGEGGARIRAVTTNGAVEVRKS